MIPEQQLIPFHPTDPTGRRVLVLAPHPDDETLGCGGTLALHRNAGDAVQVVFLTDGCQGDPSGQCEMETYVQMRRKEAVSACAVLGIHEVVFWDYPDRRLCECKDAVERLADVVSAFGPQRIYAPSPLEFHPDHRAAACLVWEFIQKASGFSDLEIAFYEVNQPICVNTLVDITPVLSQKQAALACYGSQLQVRPYADVCLGLNRFRSLTLPQGCTHAEGYFVEGVREIRTIGLDRLPFCDVHRRVSVISESAPLVSVLVRTRNRPLHLAQALRSIVAQTYRTIEIVVVNDGGGDIGDVLHREAKGFPVVHLRHEKPLGRAAAANAAMRAAHGQYLNFLDDDDIFYPDHVATLVGFLVENGADVAYTGVRNRYYRSIESVEQGFWREEVLFHREFDSDVLLFENYLPVMAVMFSRKSLESLESGFDETLDLFEDWEFWVRLSRRFRFHHLDAITAEYRFFGAEDIETSHRNKYAYDEAKAVLFDRIKPWMDGKAWMGFLKNGSYGELLRQNEALAKALERSQADLLAFQGENARLKEMTGGAGQEKALFACPGMEEVSVALKRMEEAIAVLSDCCGRLSNEQASGRRLENAAEGVACDPEAAVRKPSGVRFMGTLAALAGICRFDAAQYLRRYPDVAASGMHPLWHYLRYGIREGRGIFKPDSNQDAIG